MVLPFVKQTSGRKPRSQTTSSPENLGCLTSLVSWLKRGCHMQEQEQQQPWKGSKVINLQLSPSLMGSLISTYRYVCCWILCDVSVMFVGPVISWSPVKYTNRQFAREGVSSPLVIFPLSLFSLISLSLSQISCERSEALIISKL